MDQSGRAREVDAIVRHERAVEVAMLMMGKLDRPIREINEQDYIDLPRRQLKSGKRSLSDGKADEVRKWLYQNFGHRDIDRLTDLYKLLRENNSSLRLPYYDFVDLVGVPRMGVLRGAPAHSTIHVSPWGLQTEYPEMYLVRDVVISFNSAFRLNEEFQSYEAMKWTAAKHEDTRNKVAKTRSYMQYNLRVCMISLFNLLEAYINGLSWDYDYNSEDANFSNNDKKLIRGERSLIDRLVKIPLIISGEETGPLSKETNPLKDFQGIFKPYRDSIVHASPFSTPEKFGGYDKLSKLYDLDVAVVKDTLDLSLDIIDKIHSHITNKPGLPQWMPSRDEDGLFIEEFAIPNPE